METQALALIGKKIHDFKDDPQVQELQHLSQIAAYKGLTGQVHKLKERLLATILEKQKLKLLIINKVDAFFAGLPRLSRLPQSVCLRRVKPSGEIVTMSWGASMVPLAKYRGIIPNEIIGNIPVNLPEKDAVVFSLSRDPIIAVPLSRFSPYYVGIYVWDE